MEVPARGVEPGTSKPTVQVVSSFTRCLAFTGASATALAATGGARAGYQLERAWVYT